MKMKPLSNHQHYTPKEGRACTVKPIVLVCLFVVFCQTHTQGGQEKSHTLWQAGWEATRWPVSPCCSSAAHPSTATATPAAWTERHPLQTLSVSVRWAGITLGCHLATESFRSLKASVQHSLKSSCRQQSSWCADTNTPPLPSDKGLGSGCCRPRGKGGLGSQKQNRRD